MMDSLLLLCTVQQIKNAQTFWKMSQDNDFIEPLNFTIPLQITEESKNEVVTKVMQVTLERVFIMLNNL